MQFCATMSIVQCPKIHMTIFRNIFPYAKAKNGEFRIRKSNKDIYRFIPKFKRQNKLERTIKILSFLKRDCTIEKQLARLFLVYSK